MISPPLPLDEDARLRRLRELGVLDTPPEEVFDRITRLASTMLDVPIALVSLVDGHRQWFKSRVGLEATETPRDVSFCGHSASVSTLACRCVFTRVPRWALCASSTRSREF